MINKFSVGDKVVFSRSGIFGWEEIDESEQGDYHIGNNTYEVTEVDYTKGEEGIKLDFSNQWVHPNHFELAHYAKGGSVNTGRSWHLDRQKSNKSESWEKPMNKRKQRYDDGGGVGSIKFTDEKNHPLTYIEGVGQKAYTRHSSHPTREDAEKVSEALSKNFYNVVVPSKGEFVVYKDLFDTFSKGGGVNSGRDRLFKSKQPHEQNYKRKTEWKEYNKEGWFGDWFENGGGVNDFESDIVRNKNKNDWKSMFDFYLKYNTTPVGKGMMMNMAYASTKGIDSAIPQSLWGDVDDTSFYVYDYSENNFGELIDLRQKLKFSNQKVDVTIVVNGDVLYKDSLPRELQNATFHQALNYVFNHDEVEAFDIRPKSEQYSKGGGINSGRDRMFKSKQPHEQNYKRKTEWKEYNKEGWFGDWFANGGGLERDIYSEGDKIIYGWNGKYYQQGIIKSRIGENSYSIETKSGDITLNRKDFDFAPTEYAKGSTVKPFEYKEGSSTIYINGTKGDVEKMYLDYVNNFLTIGAFADHYGISNEQAKMIIEEGRKYNGEYANGGGVKKRSLMSVAHLVDWKGEGIKKWYIRSYPTDDLGEELNDEATFTDLWNGIHNKENVYNIMGVGDSVIRERLFEYLSLIYDVEYSYVYNKWLESADYANGGGVNDSHLDDLYSKSNNNVQGALELYAGELGIYNMFFGHKVDASKKAKYKKAQKYLESKYANGGGVEETFDYGGTTMTDEAIVRDNIVNGEIDCDTLTEIIGRKPNYPHEFVGTLKLEKCYLKPYYRIA